MESSNIELKETINKPSLSPFYFCTNRKDTLAREIANVFVESPPTVINEKAIGEASWWREKIALRELSAEQKFTLINCIIREGPPDEIRGLLWNFLVPGVEEIADQRSIYFALLSAQPGECLHEKQISRDLARTFPSHDYFSHSNREGQESLFNIMKAYSLYDSEVGYCQGLSFIAGILLLQHKEPDLVFSLLVRIMHQYDLRKNYIAGMEGLHLRLYQFDQILKEIEPELNAHFQSLGIFSMMYASQWFLTIFAYKFPFPIIFRIWDMFLAEGIPALFCISIALLAKNRSTLLKLEFEELLEFLKGKLYYAYYEDPNQLLIDASQVHLNGDCLSNLAKNFARIQLLDSLDHFKSKTLIDENANLKSIIRELEEKQGKVCKGCLDLTQQIQEIQMQLAITKTQLVEALDIHSPTKKEANKCN
jgi:hypothetical protein